MTLSEYRSQLRLRQQEPSDAGRFSDGELDSYINRGIYAVCDALEPVVKTGTLNYASGQAFEPLPLDLLRIQWVYIGNRRIRSTDPTVLDTLSLEWQTAQGTPKTYFVDGNDLRLYPIPDEPTTVSVRYAYMPEQLVEDTDESVLPNWMDEGVLLYALTLARDADQDPRAPADYQKWQQWLQLALVRLRNRSLNPLLQTGQKA